MRSTDIDEHCLDRVPDPAIAECCDSGTFLPALPSREYYHNAAVNCVGCLRRRSSRNRRKVLSRLMLSPISARKHANNSTGIYLTSQPAALVDDFRRGCQRNCAIIAPNH